MSRGDLQDIPEPFLRYTALSLPEPEEVSASAELRKRIPDENMLFMLLVLIVFYGD